MLGHFFLQIETIAPSATPTTAPWLLSTANQNSSSCMLLILTACSFIGDSHRLHPSLASLLNCSSISSFLNPCSILKKRYRTCLYIFSRTSSLYSMLIHLARCTSAAFPLFSFQSCLLLLAASTFVGSPPSICFLLVELPAAAFFPSSPSFSAILPLQR